MFPLLSHPSYNERSTVRSYSSTDRRSRADPSAREATRSLLVHINSRNPNQALLALSTLDHLVKNCGYPIHLQISTKEFLNELVRRFPERPPMITGRVMGRILEVSHLPSAA